MVPAAFAVPASAQAITCDDVAPSTGATASTAASPEAVEVVPFPEDGGTLEVFAAASLVDAFAKVEADLEAANPNLDIVVETGGSQALVTQLTEGAQADVLATANTSTMNDAVEAGLIAGEPETFTGNRLVIVAPEDNPAGIASLDDLAGDDLLLVVASAEVPVGNYSRNVLCAYAASGSAPEGFIEAVDANVVSEEEDVRSVLAKVQLGEADAGIVYASDAYASALAGTPLTVIEFPEGLDATAEYPIAAVEGGDVDLAQAFISYILSDDGQATLDAYGFAQP
jgi:molybdate transport system substrate-binding protein